MDSAVVVTCIWGTFDLVVFKVILMSFGAPVLKWPMYLEFDWLAEERNGLDSGVVVICIWDTFDLSMFQGHFGAIWCIWSQNGI